MTHKAYLREIIKDIFKLSPLLLVYIVIVLVANTDKFDGDEGRYVMYAKNLLKGYYSPPDQIYLWNGPGYSIVLMPFVKFNLPFLTAKLLNSLFLFAAIIYFLNTLRLYISDRSSLFFAYILGIYPGFSRYIHQIVTEQISVFLVCGFMFHFCKFHREEKYHWTHFLFASVYVGYLALTKQLFGYVILVGLIVFLCLYLLKKKEEYKKTFLVYLLALACCIPYLSYTYSLTGKHFYWGSQGGLFLYLMSSPYEDEYGDWFERKSKHHSKFYQELAGLPSVERDERMKKEALNNMLNNPVKYLFNWAANVGRLWFNYPFSYKEQKLSNYFYIIPNMFIFVFSILCLYPAYVGRRLIPFEIYALIFFVLVSFGGHSIVIAENRYYWPLLPVLMLLNSFTLNKLVRIQIRK